MAYDEQVIIRAKIDKVLKVSLIILLIIINKDPSTKMFKSEENIRKVADMQEQ